MKSKIIRSAPAVRVLFLLLIGALLPACAAIRPASTLPTLKIGLVAPFEGLHRPLGYEVLFGVKLALQERNAGGGVGGYRIELVALNDFDNPVEAETQARVLVADPQVIGVVGHLSPATTLAALPIYQRAGLAMSVPWTIPATEENGLVSVAANEAETLDRLAEAGRKMGLSNIMELSQPGLIPDNVEAVQLSGEAVAAGELILGLQQANVSLPFLGQVDVGSPQLPQVAGAAANGLIFVSPGPDPGQVPGSKAFIEAYQNLAGFPPGPRAVLAYDATQVLLDAIGQVLSTQEYPPTRSAVSAAITHVQHHGLSGDITFNQQGQRMNAPVWIYQIVKKEYPGVPVTP